MLNVSSSLIQMNKTYEEQLKVRLFNIPMKNSQILSCSQCELIVQPQWKDFFPELAEKSKIQVIYVILCQLYDYNFGNFTFNFTKRQMQKL